MTQCIFYWIRPVALLCRRRPNYLLANLEPSLRGVSGSFSQETFPEACASNHANIGKRRIDGRHVGKPEKSGAKPDGLFTLPFHSYPPVVLRREYTRSYHDFSNTVF
jgi:hypothetical protein